MDEYTTLPRLGEIMHAWSLVKPLHRAVADFLGATRPAARPVAASPADNPQFVQDLTALGIPIDPKLLQ